jgi:hypothetical protein
MFEREPHLRTRIGEDWTRLGLGSRSPVEKKIGTLPYFMKNVRIFFYHVFYLLHCSWHLDLKKKS